MNSNNIGGNYYNGRQIYINNACIGMHGIINIGWWDGDVTKQNTTVSILYTL